MSSIFDGIYGCIAGSWVGSSMGDPVEGWPWRKIQETYGVLDEWLPAYKSWIDWEKPAGYTEDGIERQKLMATAIIKKQDRINAQDLVATWLTESDPEKMHYMVVSFDLELLRIAQASYGYEKGENKANLKASRVSGTGVPPEELGRFSKHLHLNSTARSGHAICAINACDEDAVVEDTHNVFRVYQPATSDSFPYGAAYNAAVAHAMRPEATVDSVVQTALDRATPMVRADLEAALAVAEKSKNALDTREGFDDLYSAWDLIYDQARVHENVAKALGIFFAAKGDFRETTIAAINAGRDVDCTAASACGLSGAFSGASQIPEEWIALLEKGTKENPYTNSHRGLKETAEGIFGAYRAKLEKMRRFVSYVDSHL